MPITNKPTAKGRKVLFLAPLTFAALITTVTVILQRGLPVAVIVFDVMLAFFSVELFLRNYDHHE